MKRKQKRYTSERAILADIYSAQRKKAAFLAQARVHDQTADKLIKASLVAQLSENDVEELAWQKGLAAKARRSADRQDSVITKLRTTQDAFDTLTLPGVKIDDSVVFNP